MIVVKINLGHRCRHHVVVLFFIIVVFVLVVVLVGGIIVGIVILQRFRIRTNSDEVLPISESSCRGCFERGGAFIVKLRGSSIRDRRTI